MLHKDTCLNLVEVLKISEVFLIDWICLKKESRQNSGDFQIWFYIFFTEIIFTGQAFAALSHGSKASKIGVLIVKNPFFSVDFNKTDFPSFFDIRKYSGANSAQ